MNKTNEIMKLLSDSIEHPVKLWYSRKYQQGWFFSIKEYRNITPQRIGMNIHQALDFVKKNIDRDNFSWIKHDLKEKYENEDL